MELEQMFSNAADFSGISTSSPEEPLIFSKVIHKAVIEVSEEATEAAAATGLLKAFCFPLNFLIFYRFIIFLRRTINILKILCFLCAF